MSKNTKPIRGEVRETKAGSRVYVIGDYRPDPGEYPPPVVPLTSVVEVEGYWIGQKYGVATETVGKWKVVSRPVVMLNNVEAIVYGD